jgi:hypothetical protein
MAKAARIGGLAVKLASIAHELETAANKGPSGASDLVRKPVVLNQTVRELLEALGLNNGGVSDYVHGLNGSSGILTEEGHLSSRLAKVVTETISS